jgi:Arc/MetJ-type ribon-helix-helix transcriptional regulator
MTTLVQCRTADKKAEAAKELVNEGHFKSVSDVVDSGLDLVLDKYGKLGTNRGRS